MNAKHFRTQIGLLAEATNKELSEPLALLWWKKYGSLPDRLLLIAFEYALNACKFFPAPAEFNEIIDRLEVAQGNKLDGSAAWRAFDRRILRTYSPGVTRSFDWPDDLTKTIIREQLEGVHAIARIDNDYQLEKVRERFIRTYDQRRAGIDAEATTERRLTASAAPQLAARAND